MNLSELQQFHFLRPYWLLASIPLLIVVVLLLKRKLTSRSWQSVVDSRLLPFVLMGSEVRRAKWPLVLLSVAGAISIIALAGPVWEKLPQPVYRSQSGLVIVLDLSQSMDSTDVKPSRISRAKHKVMDILARRAEGQTALVVFAADAFVVSPLSDDVKTVESLVTSLSTDLMPNQGSRPKLAIEKAAELLKNSGMRHGHILLIADGLGANDENAIADALASTQYRVSVLAVGTAGGAPVQLKTGGLLKDRFGDIVIPKLQEQPLRNLANRTGGRYSVLTPTDKDINYLSRGFEFAPVNDTIGGDTPVSKPMDLEADSWREAGPLLLLVIAPFVALAFRKGWLATVLLCLLLPLPQTGHAISWDGLWKNSNQLAQEAFEQGEHQRAAQQFRNKQWQAAAHYKSGDYDKALELLEKSAAPEDIYNKGNALARLGRIQEAIAAYNSVLAAEPGHEDARYNKEMLEKFLKEQPSENGESDQQQQSNQRNEQQSRQSQHQQEQQNQQSSDDQSSGDSSQAQDQSGESDPGQTQKAQAQQTKNQTAQNAGSDEPANGQQSGSPEQKNEKDATAGQKDAQPQSEEKEPRNEKGSESQSAGLSRSEQAELEERQAREQWLRRIPDDPGGLLRRKFLYQSQLNQQLNQQQNQRQNQPQNASEEPW